MTGSLLGLSLLVAGHMFGGMRSPLTLLEGAGLGVVGRVEQVTVLEEGVVRLSVVVVTPLCGTPGHKTLTVFQLADHAARYEPGALAVFPMTRAQHSPHRPAGVDPDAWTVDQSQSETLWLQADQVDAAVAALTPLCGATRADAVRHRIMLLENPVAGVAGGAARDLLVTSEIPALDEAQQARVGLLMADLGRPPGVRLAAMHVGIRAGTPTLLDAVARRVDVREQPELVSAAIKGLGQHPQRLEVRLMAVLAGPPGVGRTTAARSAAAHRFGWAVGPLTMVAFGPEPDAAALACQALLTLGTPEALQARAGLAHALPGARRASCSRHPSP